MIILDASALIALLDPDDEHHRAVSAALSSRARDRWVTGALTLSEVMVRAAVDDELLATLGEDLIDLEVETLPLADEDVEPLARLRAATGLRMPDCCVVLVAQSTSGTLLTTDRLLAGLATELHISVLPQPADRDV